MESSGRSVAMSFTSSKSSMVLDKTESMSCSAPFGELRSFRQMLKVPSLVFDIELEDGGTASSWVDECSWEEEDEVVSEVQRFVAPCSPQEAKLNTDVNAALQNAKDACDINRLAQIMSALGYRVQIRTALGGGEGSDCLHNLRHVFLSVTLPGTSPTSRKYIVDPTFKEQFVIAKSTSRFAAILAAVPQVFVGPEDHLGLLVSFLCTEVATAFKMMGSVLPPWRQASSVLSKWRPRKSLDERVDLALVKPAGQQTGAASTTQQQQERVPRPPQQGSVGGLSAALGGRQTGAAHLQVRYQPWEQQAASTSSRGSRGSSFEPHRIFLGGNFACHSIPTAAAS